MVISKRLNSFVPRQYTLASVFPVASPGKKQPSSTVATNRRVRHDYFVEDQLITGIALQGSEVKSLRAHHVSLADAHVEIRSGELWLIGMHINPYAAARDNPEPMRDRKLLAHKAEIDRLARRVRQKGYTLIPLRVFFSDSGYAKVEVGLCRGKRQYDKRETIAERDTTRRTERELKEFQDGRRERR